MNKLYGEARQLKAAARNAATEHGATHFQFECPTHGESEHYTATGRCKVCTREAKSKAVQAAYWAANGRKYGREYRDQLAARSA